MNIPILGPLRPHTRLSKWLVSQPLAVPYFEGKCLSFTLMGLSEVDAEDVNNAVAAFLTLDDETRFQAGQYVFQHYQRIVHLVGEEEIDCRIENPRDIWKHVHPTAILISRRGRRDKLIYVQITAECDWEREHGLQIIYRRGNALSRVSDQDGHLTHTDAYNLPEEQDRII